MTLELTGRDLTLADLAAYERDRPAVSIAKEARRRMQASRDVVATAVQKNRVSYGITTASAHSPIAIFRPTRSRRCS